jgi:hypothetical protein
MSSNNNAVEGEAKTAAKGDEKQNLLGHTSHTPTSIIQNT